MARTARQTTSNPNKGSRLSWQARSGFTLIEILIVIAIVSLVVALGMPAIENVTYQRVNSTVRRFVGMSRSIRSDAILLNNIYRLAIDFDRKAYWVETQKQFKLLGQEEEEFDKKKKNLKKGEAIPSNFALATKYSKEPIPFPSGVAIEGVLKEGFALQKEGIAYVHFFPNGFNEQAILYINKDGASSSGYSLWLRPNLGKVDVYRQKVTSFDAKIK
jgi:prepilin-type N-terminal cleavage/methylation domain-containing protein